MDEKETIKELSNIKIVDYFFNIPIFNELAIKEESMPDSFNFLSNTIANIHSSIRIRIHTKIMINKVITLKKFLYKRYE